MPVRLQWRRTGCRRGRASRQAPDDVGRERPRLEGLLRRAEGSLRAIHPAGPLQCPATRGRTNTGALANFDKGILREVVSPAVSKPLHELELVFTGKDGGANRFIISGFDLAALPRFPRGSTRRGFTCRWASACRPLSRATTS